MAKSPKRTLFETIAIFLSRSTQDRALLFHRSSMYAKYFLMAAVMLPFLFLLAPLVGEEIKRFERIQPSVSLPPIWKLSENSNGLLTTSIRVPQETLAKAKTSRANFFVLKPLATEQHIFINGQLEFEGTPIVKSQPLSFALPMKDLNSALDVRLIFQKSISPSEVSKWMLSSNHFGLFTYERLLDLQRIQSFRHETRPWFYFGANLIIALFFLTLWRISRRKQEFSYMALFAMIQSLYHIRLVPVFENNLDTKLGFTLEQVLIFYEAAFACFLALAFSRSKRSLFAIGLPLVVTFPWLAYAVPLNPRFSQPWFNSLSSHFFIFLEHSAVLFRPPISLQRSSTFPI